MTKKKYKKKPIKRVNTLLWKEERPFFINDLRFTCYSMFLKKGDFDYALVTVLSMHNIRVFTRSLFKHVLAGADANREICNNFTAIINNAEVMLENF